MIQFLGDYPLHEAMENTPLWEHAPVAPAVLVKDGRYREWQVIRCPYCGDKHNHGCNDGDPRQWLGGRIAHCHGILPDGWELWIDLDEPHARDHEYRLIGIAAKPRPTKKDLDEQFPMVAGPIRYERQAFTPEIRSAVWRMSDGRCYYCGVPTDPFLTFTIDHRVPVVAGGTNDLDNLHPCCRSCNSGKHAMSLEAFRERQGGGPFWFERVQRAMQDAATTLDLMDDTTGDAP